MLNYILSSAVAAILNFILEQKTFKFGKNVSKRFFSETTWTIETKLPMNDHWKVLYILSVFYADQKSKMATTAGNRLTLNPMGKCSNADVNLFPAVVAILDFRSA
jgi:hypothetical protein